MRQTRTATSLQRLTQALVVGIATHLWVANAFAQPTSNDEIEEIRKDLESLKSEFRIYEITSAVGGVIILAVGFVTWKQLQRTIERRLVKSLSENMNSIAKETIDRETAHILSDARDAMFRIASLFALHGARQYESALSEYCWTGDVATLRSESPSVRQVVIECLHQLRSKPENQAKTWQAICELVEADKSPKTVQLYLQLASRYKHYDSANVFITQNETIVKSNMASTMRAVAIMRKASQTAKALEYIQPYKDADDYFVTSTFAALRRDAGEYEAARTILTPVVEKVLRNSVAEQPEGWRQILNTFVATVIDLDRPAEGIKAVNYILSTEPRSVEIFTAVRLARKLSSPDHLDDRKRIFETCRKLTSVYRSQNDEAIIQTKAMLLIEEDNTQAAIQCIESALTKTDEQQHQSGKMSSESYHYRCKLAEILLLGDQFEQAREVIRSAAEQDIHFEGEASFRKAQIYAKMGEARSAVDALATACQRREKWAITARRDPYLSQSEEVAQYLARRELQRT